MVRNVRVWALLLFWPFFFYACLTSGIKTEPVEGVPPQKYGEAEVLAVRMRSGEVYRFSEAHPAKVVESQILGDALERREIPLNQIKKLIKDPLGHIFEVVDKDGASHKLSFGEIEIDNLIAYFDEPPFQNVSLLYSQVSLITFRSLKLNIVRSGFLIFAVVGLAVLGAGYSFYLLVRGHGGHSDL